MTPAQQALSEYAPFPEPPALILDYIAARSAEDSVVDGPAPWDIGSLPAELLTPAHPWLDAVCRWLNQTYAWQPQDVIPPCWEKHQHLGYEVAALAFARADAHEAAGSTVIWHEQYERFLARMNRMLGKAGDECRVGRHQPRPARFQLDAWPPPGATEKAGASDGSAS
ncbi:hypothetical protein ACH4MU_29965 [Streptomyces albidoflavus]|uniref:Uncharacterized protein n=1 Tax=Streptomyces wadayamensis TaxID=141454 RepID=A0ABR4S5L9_9ACTN|nr:MULTISPECIES: hypothetical protein [Streptomyces]KDR60933.1 hypothetical protein DC60_02810 [Streptomyces wadayamensis]QXQ25870.1 hypothetical protein STALF2_14665 [Streptomyces albidoflavus]QXQ31799.1 hypothetical protein STALF4_14715 [Streptomyces albidoflavus]